MRDFFNLLFFIYLLLVAAGEIDQFRVFYHCQCSQSQRRVPRIASCNTQTNFVAFRRSRLFGEGSVAPRNAYNMAGTVSCNCKMQQSYQDLTYLTRNRASCQFRSMHLISRNVMTTRSLCSPRIGLTKSLREMLKKQCNFCNLTQNRIFLRTNGNL